MNRKKNKEMKVPCGNRWMLRGATLLLLCGLLLLMLSVGAMAVLLTKNVYDVGERVIVRTTPGATGMTLTHDGQSYRYLGELDSTISYTPSTPGEYSITETQTDGSIVENIFFVRNETDNSSIPIESIIIDDIIIQTDDAAPALTLTESTRNSIIEQRGERYKAERTLANDEIVAGNERLRLRTPRGTAWLADVEIREGNGRARMSTQDLGIDIPRARNAEIRITTRDRHVKSITLYGADIEQGLDIGVDEPTATLIDSMPGKNWEMVYAIDPTAATFSTGTVTATAVGDELYKCKEWNFTTVTCEGTWVKIMDLTPGQDYSVEISTADPGFAEASVRTGYTQASDVGEIIVTGSIPSLIDTVVNEFGATVFNPTNETISVSAVRIRASGNVFSAITGIKPATGWSVAGTNTITWAGTFILAPNNATDFIVDVRGPNSNILNALITVNVTTNVTNYSNNAYVGHTTNNALQYPSVYLVNSSNRSSYVALGIAQTSSGTYTVRVDDISGGSAMNTGTGLVLFIPPGWKNVSASAQTGWALGTIEGDDGAGWMLMPQLSTTITAGSHRDFLFSAIPPDSESQNTYSAHGRLLGASTSTTREVSTTIQPGFVVTGGTPLLDYEDNRVTEIRAGGGARQLQAFISIPAPVDSVGSNRWGIVIVNPTDRVVNVTQLDITSDVNIFNGVTGITPTTTWTLPGQANVRWTGSLLVPAHGTAELSTNIVALATATNRAVITYTIVTDNGTLVSSGWRTSQSTGTIQYASICALNRSNVQGYTYQGLSPNTSYNFTVRVNNSGASGAIPTNTRLEIRLPPGWTKPIVGTQTGWTLRQVRNGTDGIVITGITATTTIGANVARNFFFNATTPPVVGTNSTYRIDVILYGPTGQTATQIIQAQAQLAANVVPTVYGINATHTSAALPTPTNITGIAIGSSVSAAVNTYFNMTLYNAAANAFVTIRNGTLTPIEEYWNTTLLSNRTFDVRNHVNLTAGSGYGTVVIRWLTTSNNQTSLVEDLLIVNATYDLAIPRIENMSPSNNTYLNYSTITLAYNASDDTDLRNCSLYINGVLNQTNSTPGNGSVSQFSITRNNGAFNWSIGCYDIVGNSNRTLNYTITIDTVYPTTFLNIPGNNSRYNTTIVLFNMTGNDLYLANCSLIIDGDRNMTNTTPQAGVPWVTVIGEFTDGNHTWTAECVDRAGNWFVNSTVRTFSVDTTPPSWNDMIAVPASGGVYNPAQEYFFNSTWADTNGINAVIFESNLTGAYVNRTVNVSTMENYSYRWIPIGAGDYAWRMYANDTFGNWNATTLLTYTVVRAPSDVILLLNDTQETYVVEINETVNVTGIPINPLQGYLELSVNGSLVATGSGRVQNITRFSTAGIKNVTLTYPATQNYSASSVSYNIVVGDKTGPSVNQTYPGNNSFIALTTIIFTFDVYDPSDIANCSLYINGVLNATNSTPITNGLENSITGIGFTEANYSSRIRCIDSVKNGANSTRFNFTIDLTPPTAPMPLTPANDTQSNIVSPTFTWTQSSDTYFKNYTLQIDNAIDFSTPNHLRSTTPVTNTSYLLDIPLAEGVWYWRIVAYDFAGNDAASESRVYTVDLSPPEISIISPTNDSYSNMTTIDVLYSINDLVNVSSCSLFFSDSTSMVNTTLNQSGINRFSIIKTEGVYLWNITCVDIAGNSNTTVELTYTIDQTYPTAITLISPANNTISNDNTPLLVWSQTVEANFANYTILVSDNETVSYTNYSYGVYDIGVPQYQVIAPWDDTTWYWKVYAYDKAGNSVDPPFTYILDGTPPSVFTLLSPPNGTSSTNQLPTLSWEETTEPNFANYTILVSTDSGFNTVDFEYSTNNISNATYEVIAGWSPNTVWHWRVIAYDNVSNSRNSTDDFTYTTDNQGPVITVMRPQNLSIVQTNSSIISFIYNVTDISAVSNCTIDITDGSETYYDENLFIEKEQNQTFLLPLSSGLYEWFLTCVDAAGNPTTKGPYNVTVNVTLPKTRWYESAPYDSPQVNTSANHTAMAVYANLTAGAVNSIPKYRVWNGQSWGTEGDLPTAGSPVRWTRVISNPLLGRADEKIAVTLSDDGWLDAYVWNGSAWNVTNNIASVGTTTNARRSFDIAYESQRGRAMVLYAINSTSGTADLAYRIWNGASWESAVNIDDTSFGTDMTVTYVRLAGHPSNSSNQLAAAYIDSTNNDGRAMIWGGSSWGTFVNITTAISITTEEDIGVAYEQQSGKALAIAGTGTTVAYASYNGSSWNATGTIDINTAAASTTNWLTIKPNPAGNHLMVTGVDGGSDLATAVWNNYVWTTYTRHDAAVDGNAQRTADFGWEQTGNNGLLIWGTTAGQLAYRTYDVGTGFGAQTPLATGANTHSWIEMYTVPSTVTGDARILVGTQEVTTQQIDGALWTGSALLDRNAAFTTNAGAVTYQKFSIAPERYPPRTYVWKNISINFSIDGSQNLVGVSSSGLSLLTNATSFMISNVSSKGIYLPKGAGIRFSNAIESTLTGASYLTWEASFVNASGEYSLCTKGNRTRTANDVVVSGTARTTYTGSCIIADDLVIPASTAVRVYTYLNSSSANTVTKYIDNSNTYIELEGYPLGTVNVTLISPNSDPLIGEGENMSLICAANCTEGYCINVVVTARINDTPTTYTDIGYFSQNIVLNVSATNPSSFGNVNRTRNATFNLTGELYSFNNSLLCSLTSDFGNATSAPRNVTVLDKIPPLISLKNPTNGGGYEPGMFTFIINASDRRLGLCTLWGNWSGIWTRNQTITPNNYSDTSFTPVNVSAYGTYKWNVNCSDLAGNDAYATANSTFTVAGDVMIRELDIQFSPAAPVEGENTTIFATIRNNANRDEAGFNVSIFLGNPLIDGIQIGNNITIPFLGSLDNITVNVSLIAPIGRSDIYVLVDPPYGTGDIFESNETNNLDWTTLRVSIWQRYYGNTTGNFSLWNPDNASFTYWVTPNTTGNIFITDTDTTNGISFLELRPLGRNTTQGINTLTVDDFAEVDIAINTSDTSIFNDTVNSTFTSGGSPIQTSTFTVYQNTIFNVPTVDSTTEGNYTTGLLWDADDSTNSHYDGTDLEDVVFITRIREGMMGEFGSQDYVIKIPSRLKGYKGTTPTVTIYYELQ